jgi:hypothetical protein
MTLQKSCRDGSGLKMVCDANGKPTSLIHTWFIPNQNVSLNSFRNIKSNMFHKHKSNKLHEYKSNMFLKLLIFRNRKLKHKVVQKRKRKMKHNKNMNNNRNFKRKEKSKWLRLTLIGDWR